MKDVICKQRPNLPNLFIIFIVAFLLSSPLLTKGFFIAYDIDNHVFKLVATVTALLEEQFPPLIGSKLANGFGYSWNIFYPPLSSYIPALFKIFFPSFIGSMKLYIFFTLVASGITMYYFACDLTRSKNVALLAAIFYMTAPYRLEDIYSRGALGEALAFVFIPLLFHGLFSLFYRNGQKDYYITLGAAGLLLSHNISSLLCGFAALVYILIHLRHLSNLRVLKSLIINGLFTAALSLFFLVPLLEHKLLGNYEVFEPNMMGSFASMTSRSLYPQQLLFTMFNNEANFTLGLQLILPLCLAPLAFKKLITNKNIIIFLLLALISIFMTSKAFPWALMPQVFSYIQFPWRFLMLAVFFLSIPGAFILATLYDKLELKHIIPLIMIIFVYLFPILTAQTVNDKNISDGDYNTIDIVTAKSYKTGGCATFEYLPVRAYENIPYLANRENRVILKNGEAEITEEVKNGTSLSFHISTSSAVQIELPYIYYLGYDLSLDTSREVTKLKAVESNNGFVATTVPAQTEGQVTVKYKGTLLTRLAFSISLLSVLIFAAFIYWKKHFAG